MDFDKTNSKLINNSNQQMKQFLFFVLGLFLIVQVSTAQSQKSDWGIGLRLGDPTGITLKRYMGGTAFEFSLGRTHYFNGNYYNNNFNDWYLDQNYNYTDIQYLGVQASQPIGFQAHYLIHNKISKIGDESVTGLDWYYGFGGQIRSQSYEYDYRYRVNGDNNWYVARGERVTNVDLGADAVIGLEYTFPDVPVSIFGDAVLFLELIDNPFSFWFQGGIGGRYRF